ncbi:hypothetical protein FOA52_013162 [Chlamydomonas sp. UWO 241]|nr:hypothetical protein FOA52_013162 [Chlamydomonas sp. UWO 241]
MSILPDELFVSGIAADATEEQVTAAFGEHGEVREYVVVSKERSGGATQCALVRMTDHHGAMAAKKAMHRSELMGRTLNVRWSNTQRVIWAGNLHESVTNEVLKVAFAQFGTVQRAVVVVDAQTLATKW